jgi:hypothetical protein
LWQLEALAHELASILRERRAVMVQLALVHATGTGIPAGFARV